MTKYSIGSQLSFSNYQWRILDIKDQVALVISEDIIGQEVYNKAPGDVTWETSAIRAYLNDEFYHRLTDADRSRIKPVLNKNEDNPWYGSKGGEDTLDYIFLLSIEEVVCYYFGDSRYNLENPSPKQKYWFQKKDQNNVKRRATFQDKSWWWWLRSPGRDNKRAVYIHGDGNVGIQGNGTYNYSSTTLHPISQSNKGGLRPAMWLKLE